MSTHAPQNVVSQSKLQPPFSSEELLALAPLDMHSYRNERYKANDVCVSLDAFTSDDQHILPQVYGVIGELFDIVKAFSPTLLAQPERIAVIQNFVRNKHWSTIVDAVRRLGRSTDTWQPTEAVRKVLHDLKGGCFLTVSLVLQLIDLGFAQDDDVQRLFFAARDYRKIMRSSVRDLDPPGYEQDSVFKKHSARLLVEKWQHAHYRLPTTSATIMLDCHFVGDICERCLEFAALDRIIYNLINNAATYTTDNRITITMLPLPANDPVNVRFVFANAITADHRHALQTRYGNQLGALFRGGFTTGGSGVGMSICGELVAKAYGLDTVDQGIEQGYLGAKCIDKHFVTWFHWPVVMDGSTR